MPELPQHEPLVMHSAASQRRRKQERSSACPEPQKKIRALNVESARSGIHTAKALCSVVHDHCYQKMQAESNSRLLLYPHSS